MNPDQIAFNQSDLVHIVCNIRGQKSYMTSALERITRGSHITCIDTSI